MDTSVKVAKVGEHPSGRGLLAFVMFHDGRSDVAIGDEPYEVMARATLRALRLNTGGIKDEAWHFCKEALRVDGPEGVSYSVPLGEPEDMAQAIVNAISRESAPAIPTLWG